MKTETIFALCIAIAVGLVVMNIAQLFKEAPVTQPVRYDEKMIDRLKRQTLDVFQEQSLYVHYFKFTESNDSLLFYASAFSVRPERSEISPAVLTWLREVCTQQNWTVTYCSYPVQEVVDHIHVWIEMEHSLMIRD